MQGLAVVPADEEIRRHILESLLADGCPACQLRFIDFNEGACFAIGPCPTVTCNTWFCAYCREDGGRGVRGRGAAHAHVATCEHNISPVGGVYGGEDSVQVWEWARRLWYVRGIRDYLQPFPIDVQQRALGICERELHDVFGGYFELTLPIDYEALRAVAQVAEAHEQAKRP